MCVCVYVISGPACSELVNRLGQRSINGSVGGFDSIDHGHRASKTTAGERCKANIMRRRSAWLAAWSRSVGVAFFFLIYTKCSKRWWTSPRVVSSSSSSPMTLNVMEEEQQPAPLSFSRHWREGQLKMNLDLAQLPSTSPMMDFYPSLRLRNQLKKIQKKFIYMCNNNDELCKRRGRGDQHATSPLAISQVRFYSSSSPSQDSFFFLTLSLVSFFFHVFNQTLSWTFLENNKIGSAFLRYKKEMVAHSFLHLRWKEGKKKKNDSAPVARADWVAVERVAMTTVASCTRARALHSTTN